MAAALGGIDGLVFTAGIGENSAEIRPPHLRVFAPGSESSSTRRPTVAMVRGSPTARSKVSAWVIPTNEELMIARHTGLLLGLIEARV